jgi:hypothetical protein
MNISVGQGTSASGAATPLFTFVLMSPLETMRGQMRPRTDPGVIPGDDQVGCTRQNVHFVSEQFSDLKDAGPGH